MPQQQIIQATERAVTMATRLVVKNTALSLVGFFKLFQYDITDTTGNMDKYGIKHGEMSAEEFDKLKGKQSSLSAEKGDEEVLRNAFSEEGMDFYVKDVGGNKIEVGYHAYDTANVEKSLNNISDKYIAHLKRRGVSDIDIEQTKRKFEPKSVTDKVRGAVVKAKEHNERVAGMKKTRGAQEI